jgi:prolipoprotein diacylglyceryl transferase
METAINILGLKVYWYGVMVTLGIGLGWWLARRRAKLFGLTKEVVDSAWLWMFGPAVVGARLYHVISAWQYYWVNPKQIVEVNNGGLGIIGAILGGILGLAVFAKVKGVKLLKLTDLLAPSLALAQAVGRWGNWFNQEAYGLPTSLPWGMFVRPENRLPGFEGFNYFHPWMVYESLLDVVNLGILVFVSFVIQRRLLTSVPWLSPKNPTRADDPIRRGSFVVMKIVKKIEASLLRMTVRTGLPQRDLIEEERGIALRNDRRKEGLITALYLINYGLIRFLLEFLRLDTPVVFMGLKAAQWWGVGMIIIGSRVLLPKTLLKKRKYNF